MDLNHRPLGYELPDLGYFEKFSGTDGKLGEL